MDEHRDESDRRQNVRRDIDSGEHNIEIKSEYREGTDKRSASERRIFFRRES